MALDPYNATANYTVDYSSSDGIELRDFDQTRFMQVMVVYAAPAAVALLVRPTHHTPRGGENGEGWGWESIRSADRSFLCFFLQCGTLSLYHMRFHLGLLPAFILRDWLGLTATSTGGAGGVDADASEQVDAMAAGTGAFAENADATFEFYLAWLHPATILLVLLAPITIGVLFVGALLTLDRMFAVSLAFFFFLAMTLAWTMMRWKFEAWRFSAKVRLLFALAAATTAAFEL